jgi:uncharacterized protein (DUF952 family)
VAPAGTAHLHVALARAWEQARATGTYAIPPGPGGAPAPFIHLCFPGQLSGVLERHFAAEPDPLVLLEVDPAGLDVRLEPAPDGAGSFPHLYGTLPVRAVRAVHADPRPDRRPPGS